MKRGLVRFNAAYHSGLERDVIPKLLRRMTEVGNLVKLTWSINCFYFFSKKRHSLICFLTPTSEFLTNSKTWLLIQLCQYDLFWSAVQPHTYTLKVPGISITPPSSFSFRYVSKQPIWR